MSRRILAAAALVLGRRPRLARFVLRLPSFVQVVRLRSYLERSLCWPLAKRLRTETEVSIIGGSRLFVRTDDFLGRALAISGVWEPNVTAAFTRFVSRGDVCLDFGAHIGYYTLLASKLVGREGHVYAFEPSPSNYQALRANLIRNGVANVTALEVAVAQAAGRALLNEGTGTNTGRATLRPVLTERDAGRRQVMVDVRPVAASVPERDFGRVRVIKIDVEGYEVEVLRSLAPIFDLGERLAVFLEITPGWIDSDATAYLGDLCRVQQFRLYRLATGYSVEDVFPGSISEPQELNSIPSDQCDLLLTR